MNLKKTLDGINVNADWIGLREVKEIATYRAIRDNNPVSNHKDKSHGIKFILDSAVLRNNKKYHFTSYITLNGKEYAFEGASHKRLREFNWKSKLVSGKNISWNFDYLKEIFNFKVGYQILFYYKV